MTPTKTSGLEAWLDVVRDQKMPIFEQTVHHILSISEDDLAPASALAGVVLQDASLTARLLKLANSIAYNPSATAISTVTRAVIVLGFDAVRDMCLTLTPGRHPAPGTGQSAPGTRTGPCHARRDPGPSPGHRAG
jgi:hypothetical protein